MAIRTYDQLTEAVDRNGGFQTFEMSVLRDVHGAGKLGVNVVGNISDALDHRGLSHTPADLPLRQWESVRIYRRSSVIGKLIQAASTISEESDKVLSSATGTAETEIIKRIRELVCD